MQGGGVPEIACRVEGVEPFHWEGYHRTLQGGREGALAINRKSETYEKVRESTSYGSVQDVSKYPKITQNKEAEETAVK